MVTTNLPEFIAHITKLQSAISPAMVGEVVRGKVIRLFKDIVRETPQWSGAAASVWQISMNGGGGGSIPSGFHVLEVPYSKGDEPAVSAAFAKNSWVNGVDEGFLRGCVISNPQPYAEGLESGSISLRSLNLPGRMVQRALVKHSKSERLSFAKSVLANERL